jgi:endonuclease/exonuclease/phosphatase (EEP) superfamily protein YafD
MIWKDKLPAARYWMENRLVAIGWVYLTMLLIRAGLQTLFGDRWWWLFLLNSMAEHFFWPLPVMFIMALVFRRRAIWYATGGAFLLWAWLYGSLYLPQFALAPSNRPILTVATYNLLGSNGHIQNIVATIRETEADVIALQELTPAVAETIQRDLAADYPYQILDPQVGVTGAGVISRYPLHDPGQTLPGGWIGRPQVLTLEFAGAAVAILNCHAFPYHMRSFDSASWQSGIEWTTQAREQQAQIVLDFVATHPGPLIVMTDLNAGDQSRAYHMLRQGLNDAWREAGWGSGHTFPGQRPFERIPSPNWLIRIDYVFHSPHWEATAAWIGPWDGGSDHRSVVSKLRLKTGRQ